MKDSYWGIESIWKFSINSLQEKYFGEYSGSNLVFLPDKEGEFMVLGYFVTYVAQLMGFPLITSLF